MPGPGWSASLQEKAQVPGAAAPFYIGRFGWRVRVDFHREKIDKATRGFRGQSPLTVLFPLSYRKERGCQSTACALWHERKKRFSVCLRIKNAILPKRLSNARPHPFSAWRKDAKRRRGLCPQAPRKLAGFLFQENRHCRFFLNRRLTTRGPEAPGIGWAQD